MPLALTLAGLGLFIVSAEALLWQLFRRKIDPFCFPCDALASFPKRLNLRVMRTIAIFHTILLLFCSFLLFLSLWS